MVRTHLLPSAAALAVTLALSAPALAQMSPAPTPHVIYNEQADAHAEVRAALAKARAEHKLVILDFGGNWCGDCKVLDINFHKPENQALLDKHYVLVDIDIGHMDKNKDIAEKYGVPLSKGVPALAVLDAHGNVIVAQTNGEFEDMRHMDPASVNQFLEKWKDAKWKDGKAQTAGTKPASRVRTGE